MSKDRPVALVPRPPTIEQRIDTIEDRLNQGSHRMKAIEESLESNTAATLRVEKNTADLVAAFQALQGAMKVLEMFGKLAKPLGFIVGLFAAGGLAWSIFETMLHGKGPKP